MEESTEVQQSSYINSQNVTALVIFVTTFLLIFYNTRRRPGTPPGPPLLPIVGNLFSLAGGDVLKTLRQLRHKYGDVFALYIGTELTVFLNGHEVLHEALIKKGSLFLRRPYSTFHKLVIKRCGLIYANDEPWKVSRSLVMKAFNTLFFKNGGLHLKSIIYRETDMLIERLNLFAENGKSFDINDALLVSVANVISDLLFKHRFDHDDKIFLGHLRAISNVASELGKTQVLCSCFPFVTKLPGDLLKADRADNSFLNVIGSLTKHIEASMDDQNTFIGLFCKELDLNKGDVKSDDYNRKYGLLQVNVHDVLGTGSETVSTTMLWTILYLLKHPDIQDTMFEEISRITDNDKVITTEYSAHLPYSNAVIYEAIRLSSAAPLAIPRSVPRDINFRGYLLPENVTIVTNLNSALMDSAAWEEPQIFRPDRFLNESKTEVVVPKEFLPFSAGQRSCVGESLARMELFVFMTSLVANFKFLPCDENNTIDMNGILGLTWHPKPFTLKIVKR